MSDKSNPSAYQVVMPRLGLTMTEAKIVNWLKDQGDWVEKGEPLFEIENDKATLEIESPANGYLKIQAQVGQVLPILKPVALLEGGDQIADHHRTHIVSESPVSPQEEVSLPQLSSDEEPLRREHVRATPKARAHARQSGIDLTGVTGTGVRGMIQMADLKGMPKEAVRISPVARRVAAESGVDLKQVYGSGPRGLVMRRDIDLLVEQKNHLVAHADSLQSLGGLRAIIASRLTQAWQERPQVTLTTDADATEFTNLRQQINSELESHGQQKLSYNTLLVRAACLALRDCPYMNVQLTAKGLQVFEQTHIGVAVDTERGLLVPVIHDAGSISLVEINSQLILLAEQARKGQIRPDDLSGSTFTITNLGQYEIDAFTPIINPPECAILGAGRIIERPVGMNGQIILRKMIALSLSFDHRLVDGAPAARFLQRIKQLIERPYLLTFSSELS
jgi:pyruvate dehydrogenase E2 component (dihydrolipoamide acetyltransferase)